MRIANADTEALEPDERRQNNAQNQQMAVIAGAGRAIFAGRELHPIDEIHDRDRDEDVQGMLHSREDDAKAADGEKDEDSPHPGDGRSRPAVRLRGDNNEPMKERKRRECEQMFKTSGPYVPTPSGKNGTSSKGQTIDDDGDEYSFRLMP